MRQPFHAVRVYLAGIALCCVVLGAAEPTAFRKIADISYAEAGGHKLLLDLYLPDSTRRPPLVVYVHGGGWRSGSRSGMPLTALVESGFAIASVDYRLSPVAPFPAQIHDIKAAIRFLRAKQNEYGYDAARVAISGSSAGAHLAQLTGVTNGNPELEGEIGEHRAESSDVQAIVAYFGASNFLTILKQSTPHGLAMRIPALQLLLGSQPEDKPDLAKLASPVFHVDKSDPPLLMLHGDQDPQMPINQSHELDGKYRENGLPVELEVVHGAGHGGRQFYDAARSNRVTEFLSEQLRKPRGAAEPSGGSGGAGR
jgi:acetyl esterase/lipase